MNEPLCLRCRTVALTELSASAPDIRFYECPACGRHYALKPGKRLTFRWLHPISLALYGLIFERNPVPRAEADAEATVKQGSSTPEELQRMVDEIRLELNEPTQQVRDILDCQASEEQLREFLRRYADHLEKLASGRDESPADKHEPFNNERHPR
jgi:hypothetical protein